MKLRVEYEIEFGSDWTEDILVLISRRVEEYFEALIEGADAIGTGIVELSDGQEAERAQE